MCHGFQIVLCDQIQTILVAQVVQCILILVMAGADGIDVVLLHGDDVPKQFLMGVYAHSTTRNGAELMTVGTLEHDALAVEQHPIVLQLELAETDFCPVTSTRWPASSSSSISSSYRAGSSALHRWGFSTAC